MRQGDRGRVTLAVAAAVWALAPPGQARAVDAYPYAFDSGARPIDGAESTADAPALEEGTTYVSSIRLEGKLNYRVDLDAVRNAYVSVVAVPPAPASGTRQSPSDGIKVTLQDGRGSTCSISSDRAGAAGAARPLAAYAYRTVGKRGTNCRAAGAYNILVERTGAATSTPGDWALEIRHTTEPALDGGPTEAPDAWPSQSPGLPAGSPREVSGGTGFNDAPNISEGEWTSKMEAGRTYFYRVPVSWGQQVFARAAIGSANGKGFVGTAVTMRLYNPVRGFVTDASTAYSGGQKEAALRPLPKALYENRFASNPMVNGMRLEGTYYLAVTLNPELGEKFGGPFGVALSVNVEGAAQAGTGSTGRTGGSSGAVAEGKTGRSGTMKVVGTAAFGAGTVLVLGLAAWTLAARRQAARTASYASHGASLPPPSRTPYGPPGGG
ncbi:hypothetical protein ACFXOM_15150 [Streptomyces sp. NPDC059169]|uniref:hypothetical protein n=1 Tax=unclassified Streptomyces TaxID=2593676 RepID=UPI003683691B